MATDIGALVSSVYAAIVLPPEEEEEKRERFARVAERKPADTYRRAWNVHLLWADGWTSAAGRRKALGAQYVP